jgi:hypothetical protein
MGILDYIYRLKPEAGDTSPHNEIGAGEVLSGGTITLVDRGGGDYAWQFAGGLASIGIPSHTTTGSTTGTGFTMAVTLKVTVYPATNFAAILAYSPDTTPTNGMHIDREAAGSLRARVNTSPTQSIGATATTLDRTYVIRLETSSTSAQDFLRIWLQQTGRVGTSADLSSSGVNFTSVSVDTLLVNATDSCVPQVKDWVIWHEQLSDADCAALADGLRTQLDGGGGSPVHLLGGLGHSRLLGRLVQ